MPTKKEMVKKVVRSYKKLSGYSPSPKTKRSLMRLNKQRLGEINRLLTRRPKR